MLRFSHKSTDDDRRQNVQAMSLALRLLSLAAFSAIFLDGLIAAEIAGLPEWLSTAARWVSEAASPIFVLPMLFGILVFELARRGTRSAHQPSFGVVSLCGGISALLSSAIIKHAISRARPCVSNGLDALHFKPFAFEDAFASMPSSQSALAAAVMYALARYYPRYRTFPLLVGVGLQFARRGQRALGQ
jgi:membrane-associated phospholipid phosphatase